jgi:UDP-N-acetylglucosamine 4,6-dehydratase
MNHFKDSVVTITGGTGSFGSTMVEHLLKPELGVQEVRVFSRDEAKQDELRNRLQNEKVQFFLGDVRDPLSLNGALKGSTYVFHAAALKQVPSCEFFPMQAVATNITGSMNVLESAISNKVESVVCLSTDKAVYPINAMGMSKALMEKTAQSYARNPQNENTRIAITRYGNVLMSRGSVVPLFRSQILKGDVVTVTHPKMTRFLMSLSESVDLVLHAFSNSQTGDLFVKKAKACDVETLVRAIHKVLNVEFKDMNIIGIRHGEKMYESLLAAEDLIRAEDEGEYFRVPLDSRSLDYKLYFDKGRPDTIRDIQAFTSSSAAQLSVDEVVLLLLSLPEFADCR